MVHARPRLMVTVGGARLPVLPPRPLWMDRAACDGTFDPVFTGPGDGDHWTTRVDATGHVITEEDRAQDAAAKYCDRCPVRVDCLALALKTKSPDVWAGTTLIQRNAMARTRTRLTCPVCRCETLITEREYDICVACGVSWKTAHRPPTPEQEPTHGDDDR